MNSLSQIPSIDDYLKKPAHPLRQTGGCRSAIRRECDPARPLVTIFTIVQNHKDTLPQAIMSVLDQSYPNIEYIVIDGASTDGTLEVIKRFDDKIDLWISEPDSGTSDAFNKAVTMAKGDLIFPLAADDWIDHDLIKVAVETFLSSDADFVFGDMVMYNNGDQVAVYKGDKNYAKSLMSGDPHFNSATMVVKKECYQKVGLMDLTYKYVADYEWVVRLHLNGEKGFYNSSLVGHRRVGGIGESRPVWSILEHLRLSREYGLPVTKAVAAHLYYLVRRGVGHLTKLLLPEIIYTKLKRAVRRGYSVPLD